MSDAPRPSFWNTLGWGAYLACSWTWCIGMFLPVLMIRDFGWWSFPVFAIPNCLGAAAMGWVMRGPGASEAVVAAHGRAIRAFSVVTVAFQTFFLLWLTRGAQVRSTPVPQYIPIAGFGIAMLLAILNRMDRRARAVATVVLLTSIALGIAWMATAQPAVPGTSTSPQNNFQGLAFLAPVVCFGFGLSPYLDSTFHRAARNRTNSTPLAFATGFLLFFPLMIGLTASYAPALLLAPGIGVFGTAPPNLLPTVITVHVAIQLGYTVGVHASESTPQPATKSLHGWTAFAVVVLALLAIPPMGTEFLHDRSERTYRLFMSFYGLIFPAYVWICMIPTLRSPTKPTQRQLTTFLIAVTLAAPFYYIGFIQLHYWALAPGVMIPLLARFAIGRPASPSEPKGASPRDRSHEKAGSLRSSALMDRCRCLILLA
jgi:hypothetical protein